MFWLIESQEQFEEFKYHIGREVFAVPVERHPEIHPGIYSPLGLYIRNLDQNQDRGYFINFYHPEALKFDPSQVKELLSGLEKVYTPDKKAFNYFYFGNNVLDVGIGNQVEVKKNQTLQYFSQKFYSDENLNSIIPIVKHFEQCEELFSQYKSIIEKYEYSQYKQDISDVFWFIERNGLKVNSAFERYFELERPFLNRYNEWVFSQYNLNTLTGRPSNAFNTINFAALNKENGCRSVFIPRNDFLLEIDLTAYHPTLISQLVGYESKTGDIYEDFAEQFEMERSEAKNLVFRQLYGNIYDQYKDFEFFKLTKEFIADVWKDFMADGEFEGFMSGQVFKAKDLENMNPQKLFNYLIQNLETANNVELLKDILYIINSTKTELILYTYDAFLFDFSKEDKETLKSILAIFEEKKLKVKLTYGTDYDSARPL